MVIAVSWTYCRLTYSRIGLLYNLILIKFKYKYSLYTYIKAILWDILFVIIDYYTISLILIQLIAV
mgnify:FL=1